MRPERPVGQGVELLKHAIVFVDESLVGGVVQSSRAGNLKAFRRDQEITPLANGSSAASATAPPLSFNAMHRGQPERGTIWCQCRKAGRASSSSGYLRLAKHPKRQEQGPPACSRGNGVAEHQGFPVVRDENPCQF